MQIDAARTAVRQSFGVTFLGFWMGMGVRRRVSVWMFVHVMGDARAVAADACI